MVSSRNFERGTTMGDIADFHTVQPERTTVGGSLVIPRMINGLWQLAGGHDKDIDIATACTGMEPS